MVCVHQTRRQARDDRNQRALVEHAREGDDVGMDGDVDVKWHVLALDEQVGVPRRSSSPHAVTSILIVPSGQRESRSAIAAVR